MAQKRKPYENLFSRWLKSPWPVILALFFTLIYFTLGEIIQLILPLTKYKYVPGFLAEPAANYVRHGISYPISAWFDMKGLGKILLIPYYLVVGYLISFTHLLLKPIYKYIALTGLVILIFLRIFPGTLLLFDSKEPSISYGNNNKGSLENARRLPYKHKGYTSYSYLGYLAGRTFVHEKVKITLLEAFENLDGKYNNWDFVIGDASAKEGGPMSFQEEKQNGLTVDFLLPLAIDGKPYNKQRITNYWNYAMTFDQTGRLDGMEVDYSVLAGMLVEIQMAAAKHDLTIKKIEMHPEIKRGLLGKNIASILKNILGGSVRKDGKSSPAYFTISFDIISGKGRNLMQRIFKGKETDEN